MKSIILLLLCLPLAGTAQITGEVRSPDGRIRITIEATNEFRYAVSFDNRVMLEPSLVDLILKDGRKLSSDFRKAKLTHKKVRDQIFSPVPEKRKIIPDHYNSLLINMKNGFGIEFRAYDDGIAYRLSTNLNDSIFIENELAQLRFHKNWQTCFTAVVPRENADRYHTSFEEPYTFLPLDSIDESALIFTPTLIQPTEGPKLVFTESDLMDYPGMFLAGRNSKELWGHYATAAAEEKILEGEFPAAIVTRREEWIAHTAGKRNYPWRVLMIAEQDKQLPENDLVYRLASPSRIENTNWIKPGKGTDEWIIGINLFNIPFKAGINTATYKYYIDFASRFGFERIMMDAGWSDTKDLFKIHPDINMEEISAYAKSKNIGLSMWTLAVTLDRQLEPALAQFKKWGVDFIMTDFMDRDDQQMVNFYERIVEATARYQIMVMFHGAYKTAGFNRTWPHAVTREGVLGSEYNIWSAKATPKHNLLLPFIRMTAGPMDYEPGLLDNATAETFRPIANKVMSQGTRMHQAAMFVVYESPVQLFSGNPSQGWMEPAFMELLGSVPTVWDTTIVLKAKLGEYIVTARRKGEDWFIGAMCADSAQTIQLSLDFLGNGTFKATIAKDGVNADRYASDYVLEDKTHHAGEFIIFRLASGGGMLARLVKQKPEN